MTGVIGPEKRLIYFIRCGEFVKIGLSSKPEFRLSRLQAANPYPLSLVASIPGTAAQERALHRKLAAHWHIGEWFKTCDAIEKLIRSATPQPVITNAVSDLIDAFGGCSSFARAIGLSGASTASEMRRAGRIRYVYWARIVDAAKRFNLPGITTDSLMRMHESDPAIAEEIRRKAA